MYFHLSKFQVEHVTGQFRLLILVAPCWMEASRLFTVLNIFEDIPQWCYMGKDREGFFNRLATKRVDICCINPLTAHRQALHRQGFFSFVCQVVVGVAQMSTTKIYQQCCKEWAGYCA